jgi:hypothetical protein
MADKKYEELVAEKIRAGLPRSDAEEVAKRQIAWDEEQEKAEEKAAKKSAKGSNAEDKGKEPKGDTK